MKKINKLTQRTLIRAEQEKARGREIIYPDRNTFHFADGFSIVLERVSRNRLSWEVYEHGAITFVTKAY